MTNPKHLFCYFCPRDFRDAAQMVAHLDQCHEGWVEVLTEMNGFEVPEQYPILEYKLQLAELLLEEPILC